MKYKLSVTKYFSAAHNLRDFKGKCENLHGHNWKVKATLSGKRLNKTGMIIDFADIKAMLDDILLKLDHSYLNQVSPFSNINPTAENIAGYILSMLKKKAKKIKIEEVEVWESATSSASVSD